MCINAHLVLNELNSRSLVLAVAVCPMDQAADQQNAPHGVNNAKTATHPITLLVYAERRQKNQWGLDSPC